MITFTAIIIKHAIHGLRTGWNYIEIPETIIQQLGVTSKKSFRVKGLLDTYQLQQTAVIPMGNGGFMIPINATMRKAIGKRTNDIVTIQLAIETAAYELDEDFIACLQDNEKAYNNFKKMAPSHQRYFSKWIIQAKTTETKAKRIYQAVFGIHHQMDYGAMVKYFKQQQQSLQ